MSSAVSFFSLASKQTSGYVNLRRGMRIIHYMHWEAVVQPLVKMLWCYHKHWRHIYDHVITARKSKVVWFKTEFKD